jgi:hypothetical protein
MNFASFFHRRKIFDVKSIFCRCDWNNQTIKHVIMFCSLMNDRNQLFKDVDVNNYHVMTHLSKKFKTIVKWLMQHDLLQQFSLIIELLYEFQSTFFRFSSSFFFFFFLVLNNIVTHLNDLALESSTNFERFELIFILKDSNFSCI